MFCWFPVLLGVGLSLTVFVSLSSISPIFASTPETITISLGELPFPRLSTQLVEVVAGGILLLQWDAVPAEVRYVMFQAHAQVLPVTLSYSPNLTFGNHLNSTNAGLVVLLAPGDVDASVYVLNPHERNMTMLLVAVGYSEQDPVSGACNMEFDVEIAPYLRLSRKSFTSVLEFQRSRLGYAREALRPSCDASLPALEYTVYQYFMRERQLAADEYFRAISVMLSADSIERSAQKGGQVRLGPSTRFNYNAIPGQGVIYNVVVRDSYNRTFAVAYTPKSTYSCDLDNVYDTCSLPIQPFGWIFCVVCGLFGIFLCFFGHRFFKTEMFAFGFMTAALLSFVIISKFTVSSYAVRVSMTMILGVVGGTTWVIFWWFAGVPVLSVLLVGLDLGFLLACVVFYTPFGQLNVLANDANYWMCFACVTLIPSLFLSCTMHKLSIVACAVIGSYGIILLLDLYLGTSLVYVLLNVLKRAVVEDFYALNTDTPFQVTEMVLSAVWIFLAVAGVVVQVFREWHRPPFPPPPYLAWRHTSMSSEADASLSYTSPSTSPAFLPTDGEADETDNERRPLLVATSYTPNYSSTGEARA